MDGTASKYPRAILGTRAFTWLACFAYFGWAAPTQGRAQVPQNEPATIELATAVESTASGPTGEPRYVRFQQHATRAGDRVVQRLGVHLALATKITQSGQVAHESTTDMRRQQQRTIEVLEVTEGRAAKARASFQVSRRQSPENEIADELVTQPIEGKTYFMTRTGDELSITDESGAIPPMEEFKLAAESLENVGKPNPLAEALVGRRIAVGELIRVPRELVQPLLGFEDPLGTVHRFEMTLVRVEPAGDGGVSPVGVFQTHIEVRPNDDSPLAINLRGELSIETDTCRVTAVDMSGPVQMSSIGRTGGGIYQYSAGGELKLAIRSQYDRAETAALR